MGALSLRIPDELEARLDAEAQLEGVPRSEIARTALEGFLEIRERERTLAAYVAEARAIYGDPSALAETQALADEAIPTDNEALEIAEGGQPVREPRRRNRRVRGK
jgi:predicted DNA-binding protein